MALLVRRRHWWAVGEGGNREALWDIRLHPGGELWGRFGVEIHESFEAGLCGLEILRVEGEADVGGHAGAHVETRNVSLRVLLEMELAFARGRGENGGMGGREPGMGIADDEVMKSACLEGSGEGALCILPDPDGDQNGAIQKRTALTDLFVSGVQDQVGIASQGAIPPGLEFDIEIGGAGADLGRTDGMPAKFLDDFGDFACGDTLDVHLPSLRSALRAACGRLSPCGRFGEGEPEGLFAAGSLFHGAGIKFHAVADLRNAEQEGTDTGGKGRWFERIGSPEALLATLVRTGLKDGRTLLDHGLVDGQAQALGEAGGTFGGEELQNGV